MAPRYRRSGKRRSPPSRWPRIETEAPTVSRFTRLPEELPRLLVVFGNSQALLVREAGGVAAFAKSAIAGLLEEYSRSAPVPGAIGSSYFHPTHDGTGAGFVGLLGVRS